MPFGTPADHGHDSQVKVAEGPAQRREAALRWLTGPWDAGSAVAHPLLAFRP